MTRKDSEKEAERPHYYSQFWLDVAAGRRVIGAPKPGEENEGAEPEVQEPALLRRSAGMSRVDHDESYDASSSLDGHVEAIAHPIAEPGDEAEEFVEPESDEDVDLVTDDVDFQDDTVDDAEVPDMDLSSLEEEVEDGEDFYEEEEEEDEDWSFGRGRKKNKPARPAKPTKQRNKREPRRGF